MSRVINCCTIKESVKMLPLKGCEKSSHLPHYDSHNKLIIFFWWVDELVVYELVVCELAVDELQVDDLTGNLAFKPDRNCITADSGPGAAATISTLKIC